MNANEHVIKNGCVPVALGGYHHQEEEPCDSADVKEKNLGSAWGCVSGFMV